MLLRCRGQFRHGHLEPTIACDYPDLRVRSCELCPNGRGQRKPHRAQPPGRDQRTRLLVLVILCFPHLMLAYIGDDDRVAVGLTPQIMDYMRGIKMTAVRQPLNITDSRVAL